MFCILAIENKSVQKKYIYIYPKQMEINEIIVDEFIHTSSDVSLQFLNTWWIWSKMIDHF